MFEKYQKKFQNFYIVLGILEWHLKYNKLKLNNDNCAFVSFTKKKQIINASYNIKNVLLHRKNTIKDFGVYIDNKLNFNNNLQEIYALSYRLLGFVIR